MNTCQPNRLAQKVLSGLQRAALLSLLACTSAGLAQVPGQKPARASVSKAAIPPDIMLQILRAEDERRWDADLQTLLSDKQPAIRRRAALAAGRIGDERAAPALALMSKQDSDESVRAVAVFALGEVESPAGGEVLISLLSLDQKEPAEIRARAVEALGKIVAAFPKAEEARAVPLRAAIVGALEFEAGRRSGPDREVILFGLTAALRARPENAGKVVARFLAYSDPRVRADAANTLARLRSNDGNDALRHLLVGDPDPLVRANAARVLAATEDKASFEVLLDRALKDSDLRVRVSAIRALASLKNPRAVDALLARGEKLFAVYHARGGRPLALRGEVNELLEIVTALGRILAGTKEEHVVAWLRELGDSAPEVAIAFARIDPAGYAEETTVNSPDPPVAPLKVRYGGSSVAQGWHEIATNQNALTKAMVGLSLRHAVCVPSVDGPECTTRAKTLELPDHLRAYAAFKPNDLPAILRKQLGDTDVVVRATTAELLAALPPDEANAQALTQALPVALHDADSSEAVLAILDALAKQKSAAANDAIKTALDSRDQLVRRRAVALLKTNGAGDFSDRIGTVQTLNTNADYQRALARIGKQVRATVTTSSGSFVIELLAADAPLTVDNFVMLARKGYFNGQKIPRVVPNFVIQTGDPRGDQNGGPGYQIRCEINEEPYDRGAVGMALSGKDTGGSQWFVTHSPQPHLDGGYTVFGRVISGMAVVDRIARGDIVRSIRIAEGVRGAAKRAPAKTPATAQTK
jgi:cyclophilin family peptidyl-prolyl cis-trans isomerase